MKKIAHILSVALLTLGIASCGESYEDWADPQSYAQEDVITLPGFKATAASAVDLNAVSDDSVSIFSLDTSALPANFSLGNATVVLTNPADASLGAQTLTASVAGKVATADLQEAIVALYGKAPNARTSDAQVNVNAIRNGEAYYINAGAINVVATPQAPAISSAYYVVGGTLDWGASATGRSQKFVHSSQDVYDDPIFTITIPAVQGGDTWLAIGDDAACDAIGNGDWTKLLGTTAGNGSTNLTGTLAPRSELSDDGSICVPAGYKYIRITLNMMEYSFTITGLNPADNYYVVGGLQGWSKTDMSCPFYPQSNDVQTYTAKWSGAWDLKIWNAADFGNWDNAYGCMVDGDNSASGVLIGSSAQAISAPSAEYYTFTIDMANQTYTWTKLDNQNPTEYTLVGLIGGFNGWGGDVEMKQVNAHNWYVADLTISEDTELKFRANSDWGVNWGADINVGDKAYGTGTQNGANIKVPAGTYDVSFNDITGQFVFISK